jgi:hypothetical protein
MSFGHTTVINKVAVDAGATNEPVAVPMDETLDAIIIYVINNGESTDLRVSVYSSPDGVIKAPLETLYTTKTNPTQSKDVYMVPGYLVFVAQNADGVNATDYSVIISKRA